MNLLLERTCDALVKAYFDRPEGLREISVTAMDQEDLVRAVLAAAREPTEEMMAAVYGQCGETRGQDGPAREHWQNMIDAALQ